MTYFKTGWAPKCGGSSLGQSSAKGTGTAEVPVEQGQDKTTVAEDLPTKEEGAASNGPLFFPLYLQCEGWPWFVKAQVTLHKAYMLA